MEQGTILSTIGLARRSGDLIIGLDSIKMELSKGERLYILVAMDHSDNLIRSLAGYKARKQCLITTMSNCDRSCISRAIGITNTQVVAVKESTGFYRKLLQLVSEGGDAFE